MSRRDELHRLFAEAGITMLRNEGRVVRDDLYLGGVDDLTTGDPDLLASLRGADGRATLLLSHNPDLLPDLPGPVGLVLSGHTHGGQIRLPWLGALVVPSSYGQRYAMGWVQGAFETPAYVSRGLGVTGVPLRMLCEPELTLLTLTPA
ncbi:metallophosphoesterase [Deinococcus malanensis]